MARPPSRSIGDLTFPEVSQRLRDSSILLLPVGAIEQHGPHLPLNTDVVIAEELTRRIIARWGDALDLWQLPTISISVSREHDWAPGTLCLTHRKFHRDYSQPGARDRPFSCRRAISSSSTVMAAIAACWKRSCAIFAHDAALNSCVIHPFDLCEREKRRLRMSTAERARPR